MNFEIFSIFFWNLFYVSTSIFKSGKPNSNFLSPENWPHIFKVRKSEKPCMENSAKKLGKVASKHVQNTFWTLLKTTLVNLEFWKFFDFFWNFSKPDPPWNTGQFFFEKNATKHVQNKFGQFWEQFWDFLLFWIFFDFFCENFWWLHGTLGKKFFRKNRPKTRLDTWEPFWTILELWIFFHFFLEILLSLYLKI